MVLQGLRKIDPYVAGAQPHQTDIIKLNTNENAYGPSPKTLEALQQIQAEELRKYSSLDGADLRFALAEQLGVAAEQIVIGNGSDDILSMAFLAFFNTDKPVLFPDLTYGFYKVWADLYQVPYQEIPLAEDFHWKLEDYLVEAGGIILTNPNAPTGLYRPLADLEKVVQAHPESVVIIDEAYINFGGETALPLVNRYPNVFITRTFSKDAALAGLRVGYGIGSPELVNVLHAVRNAINPYNIDKVAEKVATAAVKDWAYYEETCRKIMETRDWFGAELKKLGCKVVPSLTNFLLVEPVDARAQELFHYLESHRIYVRYFPKVQRIANYLRISIGTDEEMRQVLAVIEEFYR